MDKKNLTAVLIILIGGIILSNFNHLFELNRENSAIGNHTGYITASNNSGSPQTGLNGSFSGVVDVVSPSLVNISAVHIVEVETPFYRFYFGDPFEDFFNDFFGRPRRQSPDREREKYRYEGTGSGFIVDPEGYVLTNFHVIRDAQALKVMTQDEKVYDAEIIGKDPRTDLAVIKIKSNKKFSALKLGDSNQARIGDWVMAAGSPFGLNQTFTAGIISAVRQNVNVENRNYENMLQTDAAINRGNSGGPLVNLNGEVIGINTAIYAPTGVFSGIGFAIPVNEAKQILDQLIEKGRVVRGWLGVEVMNIDRAVQKQFNLESDEGVLVNGVVKNSPAQKAGLQRGDVIVELDGKKVRNADDLQDRVTASKPGGMVEMVIIRDGEKRKIAVKIEEMPRQGPDVSMREKEKQAAQATAEWLGISVKNITEQLKEKYDLSTAEGVIIANISPDKKGYEIGLKPGDIILGINNMKVKNVKDFEQTVPKVSLKEGVVFDVIREGRPLYVSYQIAE